MKLVENCIIVDNHSLSSDVSEMILEAPGIAAQAVPGQFVQVKNESGSTYLRRPFGIADINGTRLTIIYRLAGKGTKELNSLIAGISVSVEGPLGHGFKLSVPTQEHVCNDGVCRMVDVPGEKTLVVGGGVGIAPIVYTAHKMAELGNKPIVLLGSKNASEAFWQDFFKASAEEIFVTTDDGSMGIKGYAIDGVKAVLAKHAIKHILICGPGIMMEGIARLAMEQEIDCQVSMEKRMACGIGVCLGCTFEGTSGKRWKICADGPVFDAREVYGR